MNTLPDFYRDFPTIADFLHWWLRYSVLDEPYATVFNRYYASYRAHFGDHVRAHYTDQSREITTLLEQSSGARLLEVGTGCGTEAIWFALKGANVLALDVNSERLETARARQNLVECGVDKALELEFRLCSVLDIDDEEAFDFVWMEQAFHHVEPREVVFPTLARLLKPGGHLVISEANAWNPFLQLTLLRRRGFNTIVERTTENGKRILYGNERITTPGSLARGLTRAGLETIVIRYFRSLPNSRISDLLIGLERVIPRFAVPLFSHYNYVGRKTPIANESAHG